MRRVSTADSYLAIKEAPPGDHSSNQVSRGAESEGGSQNLPRGRTNLFSRLTRFFHFQNEATPKIREHFQIETAPEVGVSRDDYLVLPSLLQDMLERGLYSVEGMLNQLQDFIRREGDRNPPDWISYHQKEYVAAVFQAVSMHSLVSLEGGVLLELVRLVSSTPGAFEKLFHCVLATPLRKCADRLHRDSIQFNTVLLETFLTHVDEVNDAKEKRFIDRTLSFGETPLDVASRHRNSDLVLLLLRYGANVKTTWMSFRSSLEVLLFAPTMVYLDEEDMSDIEKSVEHFRKAVRTIDVKALEEKASDGYYPLHEGWRELVGEWKLFQPADLRQLCRCQIRESLRSAGQLPHGIKDLPLPSIIIKYIDLQHHALC